MSEVGAKLHPLFVEDSTWLASFYSNSLNYMPAEFDDILALAGHRITMHIGKEEIYYNTAFGSYSQHVACLIHRKSGIVKIPWFDRFDLDKIFSDFTEKFVALDIKLTDHNKIQLARSLRCIESRNRYVSIDSDDYIFDSSIERCNDIILALTKDSEVIEYHSTCTHHLIYGAMALSRLKNLKSKTKVLTRELIGTIWQENYGEVWEG
ncbi:hypothetical protein [Deinococcus sp. AJ005]|uniref:hypothetical protein n=1 Tax=Deinococcus sp. AJ005 TaxID=2652443 RepID=UPI00125CA5AB|nr:hypothetical protein [Deinococcus sp. AJ005]QFP77770.1 hypothetical protein DAAJ005_15910 [Deinococcus sp. AJ005]